MRGNPHKVVFYEVLELLSNVLYEFLFFVFSKIFAVGKDEGEKAWSKLT